MNNRVHLIEIPAEFNAGSIAKLSAAVGGFSKMFEPSENEELEDLDTYTEDHGEVSYAVADDSLFIRIEKTKALSSRFNVQIYLFGYNDKTPFAQMPKIRITTKHKKFEVFDKRTMIKPQGVLLEFGTNVWILRIPLQVLGDPQFILTSMKAHGGELPEESLVFRRIKIK